MGVSHSARERDTGKRRSAGRERRDRDPYGQHLPDRGYVVVYVDRTALEVFASDGLTYVPLPFTPKPEDQSISVNAGTAKISPLEAHQLKSI